MISLVETGMMNALLAVVLALPVLALGRFWHRPALVHAFWILVLVKLVAPPLYFIPVDWSWPRLHAPLIVRSVSSEATASQVAHPSTNSITRSDAMRSNLQSSWALNYWSLAGTAMRCLRLMVMPGLCLWLLGSLCWFTWQGWQIVRFTQVFLRYARLGPHSLQRLAQRLARPMGVSHAPEVWLLPAVVSPMLWSVGGKSRILFPTDLLSRLDEGAVATLLTHELAHYRRGDHYVRLLEFLASGLFWWHPIIWLARQELEISEEKCCDAWVVSQFPAAQRQYADALLATVDFLAEDHPAVPSVACGLGEVPLLRQRLRLIMCGTAPKSLSLCGRAAVVATAMLIPISPSVRQLDQPATIQAAAAVNTNSRVSLKPQPEAAAVAAPVHNLSRTPPSIPQASLLQRSVGASELTDKTSRRLVTNRVPEIQQTKLVTASTPGHKRLKQIPARFVYRTLGHSHSGPMPLKPDLEDFLGFISGQRGSVLFMAQGKISLTGWRDGAIRIWNLHHDALNQNAATSEAKGSHSATMTPATNQQRKDLNPQLAAVTVSPVRGLPEFSPDWSVNNTLKIAAVSQWPQGVSSLTVSPQGFALTTSVPGMPAPKPTPITSTENSSDQCAEDPLPHPQIAGITRHFRDPLSIALRFTAAGELFIVTELNGQLLAWNFGSHVRISR